MIPTMDQIAPKAPEDEKTPAERLPGAQLLVLELEGVATDGRVWTGPQGEMWLAFSRADEAGLAGWLAAGGKALVVAREDLPAGRAWAERLGADFLAVKGDKAQTLRIYVHQAQVKYGQTVYIGSDLDDLTAMTMAGFAACPPQAHPWVRESADLVTTAPAGAGALREVADLLLAQRQTLETA